MKITCEDKNNINSTFSLIMKYDTNNRKIKII